MRKEICPRDVRTPTPPKIIPSPTVSSDSTQKIQSSSPEVTALLTKADKLIKEKKIKKGLELLHQAQRINPKDPEILVRIGTVKVDQNQPAEADRYISRALQQDPGHDLALIMREKTKELALRVDQAKLKNIDSSKDLLFDKYSSHQENFQLTKTLNDDYYQFVYHTIAIEGNTLTFQQVRDVLITGKAPIGTDVTELAEVIGMEAAIRYVNRTVEFPITEDHILNMHRRVMSGDPDNGGEYRTHQVYVGSFTPPPPEAVPRMMEEFTNFLQSDRFKKLHPIRQSALAHHTLTFIHPFVDGNGRTARLLMNQILLKAEFPYVNIKVNDRLEYYRVLDEASKGDILEFERFLMDRVDGTLARYIRTLSDDEEPETTIEESKKIHTDPSYRDVIEL
ncbi:Oidioi.mRNA.OKI2018_I69.chr2.g5144.t1.cds [Oikopleura dioica]|uniref:Protein adenylyltransferase FICD n=1 Tax=Oikopleura dioica TaxID=34765 RepID=A0ABN7T389_OIKDI|nr:Oidioi.mRNA.OKI2018_I69.chr2.g5144.t1.cds [Oikopleura dioica]